MLQPTQVQHVHRDSVSDASRLLELDGLAVERVESDAFGGRVVHVVTADETASACPGCGVFSVSLKGLVCTPTAGYPLRDTGFASVLAQAAVALQGKALRAGLLHRTGPRGPGPGQAHRPDARRARACGCRVQGRTVSETAAAYGASWPVVHAAFAAHVRVSLAAALPPVSVLGIDGDPPRQADLGTRRRHETLGAGPDSRSAVSPVAL